MRQTCIFCAKPLDNSDEHIIPDSLNGRLHTKELICKKCNAHFGTNLDPILKEALGAQLHFLGFDNAPSLILSDDKGEKYKLDKNGKITGIKVTAEKIEQDGMPGVAVSGQMEQAAKAFAKKMVRTFGKEETLNAVMNRQFVVVEKQIVPNELVAENPLQVTPRLLLAIEKIMVEYYAHCGLNIESISDRLESIYQIDESKANVKLCNFRQQVRKPATDETSHLILIRSIPETKQLIAYLELFNVLCAYTILDNDYSGPDVDFSYHQDALTGDKLDQKVELHLENTEEQEPKFDFWETI
ncbi:HNH endonuclease [Pedobacter terrae]|uniref:HNH endonuclease n=1 Tax=Pedobacter terrae TaxID=405671 RepID=UPI002FFA91B9